MMERPRRTRAHYLKRNARSETIRHCLFYDCETERVPTEDGGWKNVLVFGWAAYTRRTPRNTWTEPKWFRFTQGKELWQWITNKTQRKDTLYVWAHNHYFDYSASLGHKSITSLGWTLQKAIIDSPPFVMTYKRSSANLVLVDTLNIWRMGLSQMGKLTGLSKLSMPTSWSGSTDDDKYCRRDVEIILKAVTEWANFLQDEDLGKFCLTVASQSMQTFRHRYLDDNILIDDNPLALEIARACYHGGRVECTRLGQLPNPLFLLDVNSLYPYCMHSFDFPIRLVAAVAKPDVDQVADLLKNYLLCAHVRVEVDEPMVAVKRDGKLIFPVGSFDAYVTTPELEYLFEKSQVRKIHAVAIYEKGRPFVHFVQDLYKRRMECKAKGNDVQSGHYKLLLNSFSGKWGQNGIKWTECGKCDPDDIRFVRSVGPEPGQVTQFRCFNGLVQQRETFPESAHSHPAIAAHITGYGRMVLWTFMRKITPENYFYCDTDSVLVSVEGLEKVKESIDDKALGALKMVFEAHDVVLYGAKDYVRDSIRTIKGIREKAVQLESNLFSQERWPGFRAALRKGWTDSPRTFPSVKRLKRIYSKGIVGDDGRVFPFHLDDPPFDAGADGAESGSR